MPDSDEIRLLPLAKIRPSATNPRKAFDEAKLQELAASIRAVGILEPLIVREGPGPEKNGAELAALSAICPNGDDLKDLGLSKKQFAELERTLQGGTRGWTITTLDAAIDGGGPRIGAVMKLGLSPELGHAVIGRLNAIIEGRRADVLAERPPHPRPSYELVCGERRLRAAAIAGLQVVPVIVRNLSDVQVLEIQLIENVQRADVSPLEEAQGYHDLTKLGKTPEDLARQVGKSKSWIYASLKLLKLPERAQKALTAGELSRSVAELVARIPDDKDRRAAAKYAGERRYADEALPSYRQVKDRIEREWMCQLKGAPFAQDDPNIVPSAGACTVCPFRTGNQKELYPEARADVCTRPGCFRDKVKAHNDLEAARLKESGAKIMTKGEMEKTFPYMRYGGDRDPDLPYNSAYIDLRARCDLDKKKRTYNQLVGAELANQVVAAILPSGTIRRLVPKEAAAKALKAKGIKRAEPANGRDKWRQQQAAQARKEKERKRVLAVAAGHACEQGSLIMRVVPDCWGPERTDFLRALASWAIDRAGDDACRIVRQRRALEKKKTRYGLESNSGALEEIVPGLAATDCFGLIAELMLVNSGAFRDYAPKYRALLKLFAIDLKKLAKQAKAAPSRNGKPKATAS